MATTEAIELADEQANSVVDVTEALEEDLAGNILSSSGSTEDSPWSIKLQTLDSVGLSSLKAFRQGHWAVSIVFFVVLVTATNEKGYNSSGYLRDAPLYCTFHAWFAFVFFIATTIALIHYIRRIYVETGRTCRLPQQSWLCAVLFMTWFWNTRYVVRLIKNFPGGQDYCDDGAMR